MRVGCQEHGFAGGLDRTWIDIDKDAKNMWRSALRFSAVGLEMGIAVALGYGAGWWLDTKFGTSYLKIVGLLFGIAASFMTLVRVARDLSRMERDGEGDGDQSNGEPK